MKPAKTAEGQPQVPEAGGNPSYGMINSVVVSGSTVYAAGWVATNLGYIPGYWDNGTWCTPPLPSGATLGQINSIVVVP